ncbi:MAG: exo-alpha-sialidase [Planctomycetota bacterium]|nr:exo-alpha-sialidase [Planctomycetota bacterium]MDA1212989.1 exo-alpha-sialidase [Planctomycetota bacterium]
MSNARLFIALVCIYMVNAIDAAEITPLEYDIEVTQARKGYDGKTCWVHARAGAIPAQGPGNPRDVPMVVMTTQKLQLDRFDVFYGINEFRTADSGKTWEGPFAHSALDRRSPKEGVEIVPCDFTPKWHRQTGKLLGTGATFWYQSSNNTIIEHSPSEIAYSVYDPENHMWADWKHVAMPDETRFEFVRAGCTQRVDLPDGDVLLPIYFNSIGEPNHTSAIIRCRFDGSELTFVEIGNGMSLPGGRGFAEPSLARFGEWFYLTLRNDNYAAVARSRDGLHFEDPKPWTFDDGKELGSYNTQAHWVTHSDGLFLTYTRKGANNDHVFRHRAPLFIAQVDPEEMVVIRETERILVPERGARQGNFGVTTVNESETWVTVTEWMQAPGPHFIIPVDNKRGADNSIYVAKIHWSKPNKFSPE